MKKFLSEYPELISEWHPKKNGELKPEDFTYGSDEKVWWLCPKDHDYYAVIKNRTNKRPRGCPYCSGRKVNSENNLKFLFPKIADEWHPTKNKELKPEDFTYGSNEKVWWLCPKNHDYYSVIATRTSKKPSGCPFCSNQSSSPELRILSEFRLIFDDVKNRHKIEGVEIDVYVPKFNVAIEYDGYHFHQGREKNDLEKNKSLQKRNIGVIRVRCSPLDKITENDLIVENDDLSKSDLNRIFKTTYYFTDTSIKEKIREYFISDHFLNEDYFRELLSNSSPPLENSISIEFPNLISEWDDEKNKPLTPDQFSRGSHKIIWWLCPKNHSFPATIKNRTNKKPRGCPYCSGKKVNSENNLKFLFPKIAKEWHPNKNGKLKPDKITFGSGRKVWWLCPNGHDYDEIIGNRTKQNPIGCQKCKSLDILFPEISKEWHPKKNGKLKPEDFTFGSGEKVWWLCTKGHSYDATIGNRTSKKGSGCPHCRRNSS